MKLDDVELRRVRLPLVRPFRTSFGTTTHRDALIVKVSTSEADGWGECVAGAEPRYSSEYLDSAEQVIRAFLLPAIVGLDELTAVTAGRSWSAFRGHRMAKAALETALLDAELKARGISLAAELGAVRSSVDCGVSVGITDSIDELLEQVEAYLDQGYRRVKLKIEPGHDLAPVRAVRECFGDIPLQVDANASYRVSDARHLSKLDAFDLLMIEQPLDEEDLVGHAELARRLRTPICLDESITSAATAAQPSPSVRAAWSTSSRAVSAAIWKRAESTTSARPRHRRLVRGDVGDRHRTGGQPGPGRTSWFHPAWRHLRLRPLLRSRPHRAVRP